MQNTTIPWTNKTWNITEGCSRVSAGCDGCYAMGIATRFSGPGGNYEGLAKRTPHGPEWTGIVKLRPDRLDLPLRWRKPRRIFVDSMSDLFHPKVPDEFILRVFQVMYSEYRHTFQVLTKRPERMQRFVRRLRLGPNEDLSGNGLVLMRDDELEANEKAGGRSACVRDNIWLGTSVENQEAADWRIPFLLQAPAVVRFLSMEPLLGEVSLSHEWLGIHPQGQPVPPHVSWVIVGGESGHGARRMDLAWARSLRNQCKMAGTEFFMKQVGRVAAKELGLRDAKGESFDELPQDLRIREFPDARSLIVA